MTKGFTQTYRVDYEKTFPSVAKNEIHPDSTLLCTNLGKELYPLDMKNVFLQGDLEERGLYLLVFLVREQEEKSVNWKRRCMT